MDASWSRALRAVCVVVACCLGGGGSAIAAEPAGQPEPAQAEADRLFEQGVAARKAGKLSDAEALFRKAWALKKTWDIAANLGLVELNLGRLPEGAEHVRLAIAELPPSESDKMRADLKAALDAARPDIAEIEVRCDVAGAEVLVNGASKGTTPLSRSAFASPGEIAVEVRKDGYLPERKTVAVPKGGRVALDVSLVAQPPPPPRSMVPALAMGGGGLGAIAIGGVLFGLAEAQRGDLHREMPRGSDGTPACGKPGADGATAPVCDDLRAKGTNINTMGNAGIALFAVGGAALAGAAIYWFWPAPATQPGEAATSRVVPILGPSCAGLSWMGAF
jgi:tetratricopeptide (TPR) repeat protein